MLSASHVATCPCFTHVPLQNLAYLKRFLLYFLLLSGNTVRAIIMRHLPQRNNSAQGGEGGGGWTGAAAVGCRCLSSNCGNCADFLVFSLANFRLVLQSRRDSHSETKTRPSQGQCLRSCCWIFLFIKLSQLKLQ